MRRRGAILVALVLAAVAVAQPPVGPPGVIGPGVKVGPPGPPRPPGLLPGHPWPPQPVVIQPPPKPFPVHLFTPWWIVFVVVIAQTQRKTQEEEEEVTAPTAATEYEYKILRSQFGVFKKPEKFRAALAEEARFGWELVEKFDDCRLRLRRPVSCRAADALGTDPYRIKVGAGEGAMVAWIVLAVVVGVAAVVGFLFLVLGGR